MCGRDGGRGVEKEKSWNRGQLRIIFWSESKYLQINFASFIEIRQYNNSLAFVDLIPWTFVGVSLSLFFFLFMINVWITHRSSACGIFRRSAWFFNMKSICVGRWMITRRATVAEKPAPTCHSKVRNANIGVKSSALRVAVGFPRGQPHIGAGGMKITRIGL